MSQKKNHPNRPNQPRPMAQDNRAPEPEPSSLERIPFGQQELEDYFTRYKVVDNRLRLETIKRIQTITGNALLCYVTRFNFPPIPLPPIPNYIDDSDIEGFDGLIESVLSKSNFKNVDVLFVSNGGSAESAERIVWLLRENFEQVRFILPSNAYSAATMMSFACDAVLMCDTSTLGPIDPQYNGVPARTILRGFQDLERRLKEEGPDALAANIHLLRDYSLHLLEMCKTAEELSRELARNWLSQYMLKCPSSDPIVTQIVDYFADYDRHKSHARGISWKQALDLGVKVEKLERNSALGQLARALYYQYVFFWDRSGDFYKIFENFYGLSWGRKIGLVPLHEERRN